MKRPSRSVAAPVPVLTRVRPILRKHPLTKAPQGIVTRIRIGDALLGLAQETCQPIEDGQDRLGEMWEKAHAFMNMRAQREIMRRNGTLMMNARSHMAEAASRLDDDEPWNDVASIQPGPTVEDEIDARLSTAWLEDRIAAMDHRTRCVVRGMLGMDGPTEHPDDLAERFSVTPSRIRMLLDDALEDLQVAWRAGLREANLLLTYGEPEIVWPPEQVPTPRIVASTPEPQRPACSPRYFDRVKCERGVLMVAGLRIARVGHDTYEIAGAGSMDADRVARMILDEIGEDEEALRSRRRSISRYDTAIADAMRWLMGGTSWPTLVANRILLPITIPASVDRRAVVTANG